MGPVECVSYTDVDEVWGLPRFVHRFQGSLDGFLLSRPSSPTGGRHGGPRLGREWTLAVPKPSGIRTETPLRPSDPESTPCSYFPRTVDRWT